MKIRLLVFLLLCACHALFSQEMSTSREFEASTGISFLLYQSVFSFQESFAGETALRGRLAASWDWQAGVRLGSGPVRPEVFGRLLAAPHLGAWRPYVGLELGLTGRAQFEEGPKLLRETRQATEGDISPVYIAGCAVPLSFKVWDNWRFSAMETHFGTHVGHTGRTARFQLSLLSVSRAF